MVGQVPSLVNAFSFIDPDLLPCPNIEEGTREISVASVRALIPFRRAHPRDQSPPQTSPPRTIILMITFRQEIWWAAHIQTIATGAGLHNTLCYCSDLQLSMCPGAVCGLSLSSTECSPDLKDTLWFSPISAFCRPCPGPTFSPLPCQFLPKAQ
jgi:hypothetical protein